MVLAGQPWWPANVPAQEAAKAEQKAAAATTTNPEPTPDPTPDPSAEPSPAVAAVPSDEELWKIWKEAGYKANPSVQWLGWSPEDKPAIAAHRALYDYGYRRCLEEAKATSELNSELTRDLTLLQEENAQLKSTVDELVSETHVLDRRLNNAAREIEYKERHLDGAYRRIKELERENTELKDVLKDLLHSSSQPQLLVVGDLEGELERRGGEVKLKPESESEPAPAPEPAVRKAVQIAGHNNALSALCDDGTVWLWTSYDGWTPYKTIPQTPIQ